MKLVDCIYEIQGGFGSPLHIFGHPDSDMGEKHGTAELYIYCGMQ